jgi:hypothetical protein
VQSRAQWATGHQQPRLYIGASYNLCFVCWRRDGSGVVPVPVRTRLHSRVPVFCVVGSGRLVGYGLTTELSCYPRVFEWAEHRSGRARCVNAPPSEAAGGAGARHRPGRWGGREAFTSSTACFSFSSECVFALDENESPTDRQGLQ